MDYFSQYVTENFTAYVNRKRNDRCMGNHIEMQAMAEMFNRSIEVYQYSTGECRQIRWCSFADCNLTLNAAVRTIWVLLKELTFVAPVSH